MATPDSQTWTASVSRELTHLPTKQAAVLNLIYFHRFTQIETARYLDTPLADTKHLIACGLRTLGRALATEGSTS